MLWLAHLQLLVILVIDLLIRVHPFDLPGTELFISLCMLNSFRVMVIVV